MKRGTFWLMTMLAAAAYTALLYGVERSQWPWVLGLSAGLFLFYFLQLKALGLTSSPSLETPGEALRLRDLLGAALLLRLIAFFALPPLSDDYFRFIWDGRLWNHGVNPFLALPSSYLTDPAQAAELGLTPTLFQGLNSPDYHTIYPPVLQFIFWVGTALFPQSIYGSVMVMKAFLLLAELGTLSGLLRLLRRQGRRPTLLAFYALNPLVVVELVGNLHFEALMIYFLLGSLLLLRLPPKPRWLGSATLFVLSVGTKLLPLMLLPLLLRRLGWGRAIAYGAWVLLLTALMFAPIFDREALLNLSQSIDLYFHRFEFNASLYYLIRWIGFEWVGHNVIRQVGSWLALAALSSILAYAFLERRPNWSNLPNGMLWVMTLYMAWATVVHPWYASTLVALVPLTRWRWPLAWSALLPLSYFTYRNPEYPEELTLTMVIYLGALAWGLWEVKKKKSPSLAT